VIGLVGKLLICMSYWRHVAVGRQLKEHGYEVRLMSPESVRTYVKAQKNDGRDGEAIAEAATRPTMRFVALRT